MGKFKVAITTDFMNPNGELKYDIGLDVLKQNSDIEYTFVTMSPEVQPEEIAGYDVVMTMVSNRFTSKCLEGNDRLVAIAKFGVGYNNIDTDACTDNDVLVFITPEGVVRPVAVSILTYILALSTRIFVKDQLVREGRWKDKTNHMGIGLKGKVVGSIGFGGIAKEFFRIAKPLDMKFLATDPYASADAAKELGVTIVDLETLLKESDFVCINCPLTPETNRMFGEKQFALMKPSAFLINTARGEIVNQRDLTKALQERHIQGAALDVFEVEPLDPNDPLTALDNVILAPHGLAWTDELFRGNGEGDMRRILKVAQGGIPESVVNPAVLNRPGMLEKLTRYKR
ncbi:MAG: dehydrogenase [Paenibacillus sp.]|jgi:phosphoglycerate dehydrogenase-like enzyme|nr:dehydrogenase [Paenibacillus sp.]